MTDVRDIIEALPSLSEKDRKAVRAALDMLAKGSQSKTGGSKGSLLWDQYVSVGRDRGITLPVLAFVQRHRGFARFEEHAEFAIDYVVEVSGAKSKTEIVQAARIVARAVLSMLMRYRDRVGLEITPAVVMSQTANAVSAIEAQWPGGGQLKLLMRGNDG